MERKHAATLDAMGVGPDEIDGRCMMPTRECRCYWPLKQSEADAPDEFPEIEPGKTMYDIALEVTDEVLGAGTYAEMNRGNNTPGVQAAIRKAGG